MNSNGYCLLTYLYRNCDTQLGQGRLIASMCTPDLFNSPFVSVSSIQCLSFNCLLLVFEY